MRSKLVVVAVLAASIAQAQEPKKYHSGQLLQMESLQCTVFENPSSDANAADTAVCQEYVLRGEDVSYRIEEDRFFVKLAAGDRKEHEYKVVSMEPRDRPEATVQSAMKINHLQ